MLVLGREIGQILYGETGSHIQHEIRPLTVNDSVIAGQGDHGTVIGAIGGSGIIKTHMVFRGGFYECFSKRLVTGHTPRNNHVADLAFLPGLDDFMHQHINNGCLKGGCDVLHFYTIANLFAFTPAFDI